LLNLLAIVLFFAVEAHHQLFRALAYSVQHIPLGRGISELHIGEVVTQFGIVFSYGLAIVAPAVLVLFLLDVAMALLGRTMPQMNVFVVSMPLKVAVGVATLALSTQYMLPLVRKIFESLPVYWNGVLGLGVRG
jgi:flagellar biosynthetic protein FliR